MSQPFEWVSDANELTECCARWRAAGRLAFDTEFIRDETFDARLCLVQVCDDDGVTLIDPLDGLDLAPFWELVTDPDVLTIVHAGKEDFEVCLRAAGRTPRNVVDVQIAAGLVGYGYPLSLMRLAEAVVNKRIVKGATLTDWSRRPLTDEQLRYAVDDVLHLPAIERKLSKRLAETKRTAWAREEFERFEDERFYDPPIEDKLFKLKGSRRLDGLSLAVLQRLILWREEWAKQANRPIRALVRDDVLVEIARRRPKRAEQLEVLRGFHQARNKSVVTRLLAEIESAARTPREQWPDAHEPREETPLMKAATEILSACARSTCEEAGVANELFGSTQRLRELIDHLREAFQPASVAPQSKHDGRRRGSATRARRAAAETPAEAIGDGHSRAAPDDAAAAGSDSRATPDSPEPEAAPATALPVLLRGWRREFLGLRLVDLLEGRCELHLSGWPHELRLEVVQAGDRADP